MCPDIKNIKSSETHVKARVTKESDIERKSLQFDILDIEISIKCAQRSITV